MDIVITHDWPCGITDFGDKKRLLRIKPHFTEDVEKNRLGNPASMELLHELKPHYWFFYLIIINVYYIKVCCTYACEIRSNR